jgi:hypothetical protein
VGPRHREDVLDQLPWAWTRLPLFVEPGAPERIEYYAAFTPVDRPDRDLAVGPEHEPGDPATDPLVLAHAGVQPVAERVLGCPAPRTACGRRGSRR